MRLLNHILIFLIIIICSVGFSTTAGSAPTTTAAAAKGEIPAPGKVPEVSPPSQEHKIVLAPFYRLQSKGSKVWMERILVTFTLAVPKNCLELDCNNPTFRKMVYELLQSGEPEATIQAQAVDHFKRQVGLQVDPAVQISRSVLIVR